MKIPFFQSTGIQNLVKSSLNAPRFDKLRRRTAQKESGVTQGIALQKTEQQILDWDIPISGAAFGRCNLDMCFFAPRYPILDTLHRLTDIDIPFRNRDLFPRQRTQLPDTYSCQ